MRSDEQTFTAIVRQYQKPLYGYIRRMVIRHEDTEDILQETFAKAFRKLWQVRNEASLGAWLFRIATNETRRHMGRTRDLLQDVEMPEPAVRAEDPDAARADHILIPRAISTMTALEKEVFCLKYYEDMDYDEISRITGSNKNTLMVAWHNAKNKVKKEILK